MHRTLFINPYSPAMLISQFDTRVDVDVFGWRNGFIEKRGYHKIEECAL